MIASPEFEYDLINILSKISLKGRTAGGASPPQSFQVYISEYIPFWNDADTGCNEISWSIYSWFREAKLSASLRKQMKNLVDDLNNVLRAVAEGLNWFMGTYFVDGISPYYEGYWFREPFTSKDYLQSPIGSQTWFWAYYSGDFSSGSEGPDPTQISSSNGTILSDPKYSINLTEYMMELLLPSHIKQVNAQNPPWKFNPAFGSPNMTAALNQAQGVNLNTTGLTVTDQPGINDTLKLAVSELTLQG